ncbi:MAG: hypothetical protein HYR97_01300 [Candidatus Melainabacteria bacterium]|nr:hypothetical protein [Candidatus Melainabacteria bacterium]
MGITTVTGLGNATLSTELQSVLKAASLIRAKRNEKRIDERELLGAMAKFSSGSATLISNGGIKPTDVSKELGFDIDTITFNPTDSDITLDLSNDFGIMGGFYLKKAAELAALTKSSKVKSEHLLFTSVSANRTALIPRFIRDNGQDTGVDKIRKELGLDPYYYSLFCCKAIDN